MSQDVDLSITRLSAQDLKDFILNANPRTFYLKLPDDPTAAYHIPWYRRHYLGVEYKIDALVPATMHIPYLPSMRVTYVEGTLIVAVAFPSLISSRRGTTSGRHRRCLRGRKRFQDAANVKRSVVLRVQMRALRWSPVWGDEQLFSKEFVKPGASEELMLSQLEGIIICKISQQTRKKEGIIPRHGCKRV